MAARRSSWSARRQSESRVPQTMSVGAWIRPSAPATSSSRKPSNAARHTRAGTLRLSCTTMSRNAGGIGRARVLSWNWRTKAGSMGSVSLETADSQNSTTAGLPR
jgi:hypothetical protein